MKHYIVRAINEGDSPAKGTVIGLLGDAENYFCVQGGSYFPATVMFGRTIIPGHFLDCLRRGKLEDMQRTADGRVFKALPTEFAIFAQELTWVDQVLDAKIAFELIEIDLTDLMNIKSAMTHRLVAHGIEYRSPEHNHKTSYQVISFEAF